MIDLHCHVIPGIDDGPETIEDSLALCEAARAAGTDTIVATSHVNWDYPTIDAVVIHTGLARLNAAVGEAAIGLRLRPGAEMGLSRVADLSDAEVGVLRLGGGPYALVECPHQGGTVIGIEDSLRAFAKRGHLILLAHPERSPTFRKHPRMLGGLLADGMLSCITARSLTGDYGRSVQAYAWQLLEQGLVHAIASDAHDLVRRPPDLGPALDSAGLDGGQIEYFTGEAPSAILAGEPVPEPPRMLGQISRRRPPKHRRTPRWLTTER